MVATFSTRIISLLLTGCGLRFLTPFSKVLSRSMRAWLKNFRSLNFVSVTFRPAISSAEDFVVSVMVSGMIRQFVAFASDSAPDISTSSTYSVLLGGRIVVVLDGGRAYSLSPLTHMYDPSIPKH